MARWQAHVKIQPKGEALDPQGEAVERSLKEMGYQDVERVRVGKWIQLEVEAEDSETAKDRVTEMCDRLLVNLVMERYEVEVAEAGRTE